MVNYYKYNGAKILMESFDENPSTYENIYICAYDVNNKGKYPFQRFLLTNTPLNKTLNFPTLKLSKKFNKENIDEFIHFSKVSLFGLFYLYMDDFVKFNSELSFNGFYEFENNLYMFFDLTNSNLKINDVYMNNHLWFATIEEIINLKCVCDVSVENKITRFFIENDEFCFLLDENKKSYEIPIIGYVGKPESMLNYIYTFGESKKENDGMFGPYYYFTNFNGSLDKDGLIRFAIFPGVSKYIENDLLDPYDNSEIKKQRLQDQTIDQNFERLTMRITDYDGRWRENYDSVILGKIELDNGTFISNPIIVVDEYFRQIPLSYHYVNKNTLNGENKIM
jgi:hypothetical protein